MILESSMEERTPTQKLAKLIKANGDLSQAELIASSIDPPIDMFEIFASDYQVVSAVLGKLIDDKKIRDFLYMVADNSFYEMGFFNAMFHVLPNFPSLTFGMSLGEINELINNDPEIYEIYLDADMALGMGWSSAVTDGSGMLNLVKEWLIAIAFLKIEKVYTSSNNQNLSSIINSLMKTS